MSFGLMIKPESFKDGSGFKFNDCTTINYITDIEMRFYSYALESRGDVTEVKRVNKSANSKLLLVPVITGGVVVLISRWGWYPVALSVKAVSVDDNKVTITRNDAADWSTNSNGKVIAKFKVYEIFPTETYQMSDYGIMLKNTLNFTKIIDQSKIGLIVYKNKHFISGKFDLKPFLPNESSYIVFGDWNSASAVVDVDYTNCVLNVTGDPVNIDIIIVCSNIKIDPPTNQGLVIKSSATKELSFSSKYGAVPITTLTKMNNGAGICEYENSFVSLGSYSSYIVSKGSRRFDVHRGGLIKQGKLIKTGVGSYEETLEHMDSISYTAQPNISLLTIDGNAFTSS